MSTPTAECPHTHVASHGIESCDRSQDSKPPEEHESGWCRDCAQYVQRELDGVAWTLRPGYDRGAWLWRAHDQPLRPGLRS
jgi:hypothetical protein